MKEADWSVPLREFGMPSHSLQVCLEIPAVSFPDCPITSLRRCTYSGRPFGEETFVTRLEDQFQRSWHRWGFEKLAASA
jgi:hypothetical protein